MNKEQIKALIKAIKQDADFNKKISSYNYANGNVELSALMYGDYLARLDIIKKLKSFL